MAERYYHLLELARLLYELQEQDGVRHDYGELLREKLPGKYAEVSDLLLRQLTLLRRSSRHYERGAYRSERQDLTATMRLLMGELRESGTLSVAGQLAWARVSKELRPGRCFRRKDVESWTGYSKTQAWNWISNWERQGLIRRVGGSSNRGYYFELAD